MIRQAYGSSNGEFITCNKTSIILTYRRKGTRNDGAPPASQGQGRHNQRFRSRDLFCLFLKKGNHMRNLNTEELKQVYGGGGGSCASASKSKTGSKSGGSRPQSRDAPKSKPPQDQSGEEAVEVPAGEGRGPPRALSFRGRGP